MAHGLPQPPLVHKSRQRSVALFEALYRSPFAHLRSPLLVPTLVLGSKELLEIPPSAALDDLCTLSWSFYDTCTSLINGVQVAVLNPTFDSSLDVGGADADVILDGCLLEFKASIEPKLYSQTLYQLL